MIVLALSLLTGASLALSASSAPDAGNAAWRPPEQGLSWEPPPLNDPITINIPADQSRRLAIRMDADKDYIINMPDTPLRAGLMLIGGRNVVLIGGEISIPWQGEDPSIGSRTMLVIRGATGTVHVEGLRGGGEDLSEGIQIDAPDAVVQLQNIRIDGVRARDTRDFSDNHPDLIQTYGNVEELRIDGFTGSSDYQGVFLTANYNGPHGRVIARRMNIAGAPTARYLWWVNPQSGAGSVVVEDIWIAVPDERNGGLGNAVWPNAIGTSSRQAQIIIDEQGREVIVWPAGMEPIINGMIYGGAPPTGDFVPAGTVGIGYQSPWTSANGPATLVADAGILPSPTPFGTGTAVVDAGILATPTLTPSPIPPSPLPTLPPPLPTLPVEEAPPVEVPDAVPEAPGGEQPESPKPAQPDNPPAAPLPNEPDPPPPTEAPVDEGFVAGEPGLSCGGDRLALSVQGGPTTITSSDPSRQYTLALTGDGVGELQIATMAGHPDNGCLFGPDNDGGRDNCDQGQDSEAFSVFVDGVSVGFVGDYGEDRWDALSIPLPPLSAGNHTIEFRHAQSGDGAQSVSFKALACVAPVEAQLQAQSELTADATAEPTEIVESAE